MRCYRVDEAVHQGIPLRKTDNGVLGIDVGDYTCMLDEAFSSTLLNAKERVIGSLREALDTGEHRRRKLSDEEIFQLESIYDYIEPESIKLLFADVGPGSPHPHCDIVRESAKSPDALVLLETAPGEGGQIEFMCNTFYEYFDVDKQRVEHAYSREFPSAGVTIVARGRTTGMASGAYLLRMAPNSSIRIERTGKLDGAPRVFTLSWKVWRLQVDGCPLTLSTPGQKRA